MNFYWIKTSAIIKKIFSNLTWDIPNSEKKVYLTFDDGPTPELTEWILEILKKNEIKATFFCVGENLVKYPDLAKKIILEGHIIANHTYNHLNGWKTSNKKYFENINLCDAVLNKAILGESKIQPNLFRPPYGKIKPSQARILRKMGYKIIMWDVLSADYLQTISTETCLNNVTTNTTSGSIIVFHDNPKALKNLEYALPQSIQFLKENGYTFDVIR